MLWFFTLLATFWLSLFSYVYWLRRGRKLDIATHILRSSHSPASPLRHLILVFVPMLGLWLFGVYPAASYEYGFGFAYLSLGILLSFAVIIFLYKRLYLLGARYGGKFISNYWQSSTPFYLMRVLAILILIFLLMAQARLSSIFLHTIFGGYIPIVLGLIIGVIVPLVYLAWAGLDGALLFFRIQLFAILFVPIVIFIYVLAQFGGWLPFSVQIFALNTEDGAHLGNTGLMFFAKWGDLFTVEGWNYRLAISFALLFLGMPMLTLFFATFHGVKGFDSAANTLNQGQFGALNSYIFIPVLVVGVVLIIIAPIFFLTAHFLKLYNYIGLNDYIPLEAYFGKIDLATETGEQILVAIISAIWANQKWLALILSIVVFVCLQTLAIYYLGKTAMSLSKDVVARFKPFHKGTKGQYQAFLLCVALISIAGLVLSLLFSSPILVIFGLILALSCQILPLALALTYWQFPNCRGISWGIIAGVLAIFLSDKIFIDSLGIFTQLGLWQGWPLGLHSVFWGLATNIILCVVVSYFSQSGKDISHRQEFHQFLRGYAGLPRDKRGYRIPAIIMLCVWLIFALGPGAHLGNFIFGTGGDLSTWLIPGLPSIWLWQILWWLMGLWLLWFLAVKMEFAIFRRD